MTEALSKDMHEVARPRHLSRELLARWETSLREWNAPARVLDSWRALDDPRTRIVVTGQQPGPWGGPLYTFYKAATAIALAERIAARDQVPAVSVFWMQSEDTDWGEIGWGALPHRDLRLYRHRFDAAVPARHWVGSARVADPPEARSLVEEWGEDLGDLGPSGDTYELGARFAGALLSMFGDRGLLPLDGRWPELRLGGRALWERYLPRHRQLTVEVVTRGRERGLASPLDETSASNGLFVLDGEKRRPVESATWEQEVSEALNTEPARLAPSVLLRAPLQDHLLGSVAHVVGNVEAAYLDQLHPVYAALGIAEPVRVPRLSATVLPQGLVPSADRERALEDPEAWIAEQARAHTPPDAGRTLTELRRQLETAIAGLETLLGNEQESAESVGSARRKIDFELKRLEEMLERRSRRELYRSEPRLRHLAEFLRPKRGPQERGISSAMLRLLFGRDASSVLADAARDHVAAFCEGRTAPRVLEATRV
jgi:uncharacterized protein YllA (UPF0747 family)